MRTLRFNHATNRNTKAYTLDIGPHELFISYETVIGYRGPSGAFRLDNVWGPTTGRHINEMGIKGFEVVERDDFEGRVARALGYSV